MGFLLFFVIFPLPIPRDSSYEIRSSFKCTTQNVQLIAVRSADVLPTPVRSLLRVFVFLYEPHSGYMKYARPRNMVPGRPLCNTGREKEKPATLGLTATLAPPPPPLSWAVKEARDIRETLTTAEQKLKTDFPRTNEQVVQAIEDTAANGRRRKKNEKGKLEDTASGTGRRKQRWPTALRTPLPHLRSETEIKSPRKRQGAAR